MKIKYFWCLVFFAGNILGMDDILIDQNNNDHFDRAINAIQSLQDLEIKKFLDDTEAPLSLLELRSLKEISESTHQSYLDQRNTFFNEPRQDDLNKSLFSCTAMVACSLFILDPKTQPEDKEIPLYLGVSAFYFALDNMYKFLTNDTAHHHVFKAHQIKQLIDWKIRVLESTQESQR